MPRLEGGPPQFSMNDVEKLEAQKCGERLVAYLNGLDLTGPPPAYYEGSRAGNLKHIIEDAQNPTLDTTCTHTKET